MANSDNSRTITCCDVHGCLVNSKINPDALFFPLINDPTRRLLWLKMMKREDLMEYKTTQDELKICSFHFAGEDIIETPTHSMLKKDINPSRNMPLRQTGDAAVQAQPWCSDSAAQTNPAVTSHMVCQAGSSYLTQQRKKKQLQESLEQVVSFVTNIQSSKNNRFEEFRRSCNEFLGKNLAEIVKCNANPDDKNPTLAYKIFCLNLHHVSPKAYRLIAENFDLPRIGKLREIKIPMPTKINEDIMSVFQIKVRNMTETEKYCSVAVDVIRLKYNLFFSTTQDKIIGFHDMNGLQTPIPARYAVVLVVRGIFTDWIQPVGYGLSSATNCRENREEISKWINQMLTRLLDMGLNVKTFVCTAKSKLLNEANKRRVSVDKPYFMINGVKIFYLYDFHHMFRMLRNQFLTHDFQYDDGYRKRVAKFNDVTEFNERDKIRKLRLTNKLTDSHLNPSVEEKRDSRYAVELLSRDVAVGMDTFINFGVMHEDARDTVDFVMMMNDLHEMLTSLTLSSVTYRGYDSQKHVLDNVIKFCQSLKLVKNNTKEDVTTNLLFVKGILITVKSISLLFDELKEENFKQLLTGRLTLTVTEKFFKRMKTKGNKIIELTCQRFMFKFRQLYCSYVMKPHRGSKFSEDLAKAIFELNEIGDGDKAVSSNAPVDIPAPSPQAGPSIHMGETPKQFTGFLYDTTSDTDVATEFQLQVKELKAMAKEAANVMSYGLIGILLKKCVLYHDCDMLKSFVSTYMKSHILTENQIEESVDVEMISTSELFDYVARMENIFREVFENSTINLKLVSTIYERFTMDMFLNTYAPCPCFPTEFFQTMFILVRIYMTMDYNNALYRKKSEEGKVFVIPRLL